MLFLPLEIQTIVFICPLLYSLTTDDCFASLGQPAKRINLVVFLIDYC